MHPVQNDNMREFLYLVLGANLLAWPVGYFLMQKWLQSFAYRIQIGIGPFLLAALMSAGIALISVSYQSLKAAYANPVDSLRYE